MSGAADDFAYEHLGIFSWTTEFWDIIYEATGHRSSTKIWYVGPTVEEELSIAKWADANAPGTYVEWYDYLHPQLGQVQIGGPDYFRLVTNPPQHLLKREVEKHAEFALHQAMLSPKLEILLFTAEMLGNDSRKDNYFIWKIKLGNYVCLRL